MRRLIIALIALGVLAGGALAYWHFLLRGVLDGETIHDFGTVDYADGSVRLEHTFQLTNRQDHPVTVSAVKPDCGCVLTDRHATTLAPGQTWNLPVTMVLAPGPKTVLIRVFFEDEIVQILKIKADGRLRSDLQASTTHLALEPGTTLNISLAANIFNEDDEPPPPIISVPKGVNATFGKWKLTHRPKDNRRSATQWQGDLTLSQTDATLSPGSSIHLEVRGINPLDIPIDNQFDDSPTFIQPDEIPGGLIKIPG